MLQTVNRQHIVSIVILVIFIFGIYANSFQNEFVWDDQSLIVNSALIKNPKNIIKIFTTDIFFGVGAKSNFYRPIQNLSYLFDYSFWKLQPFGYHLTNTIIHTINAILLYFLILLISRHNLIAAITSILFAIHPVHSETVTYISGRADSLCVLFMLLSIIMFLKFRLSEIKSKQYIYYLISMAAFTFSLLSKEIAIILPFLIIICDYMTLVEEGIERRQGIKNYIPFFLLLSIYGILRFTILRFPSEELTPLNVNIYSRMFTFLYVILQYIKILFLPFNLHMERLLVPVLSVFEPRFIASIVFLFVMLFITSITIKNKRVILFGLLWFLIALLPVSNIVPINAFMAEHWLYLPSIGIFFIFAAGLNILFQSKFPKIISRIILALVLIYFLSLTVKQNFIWRDGITLYKYLLKFSPGNARIHYNLGKSFEDRGMLNDAVVEYDTAIKLRPRFAAALNNLGTVHLKKGNLDEAVSFFTRALKIEPSDYQILINLAEAYRYLKRYDEAIGVYSRAIPMHPDDAQVYLNLGAIYTLKKDFLKAAGEYEKALSLNLDYALRAKIYFNLGIAYLQLQDIHMAKSAWLQALKFDSSLQQAKENLRFLDEGGY